MFVVPEFADVHIVQFSLPHNNLFKLGPIQGGTFHSFGCECTFVICIQTKTMTTTTTIYILYMHIV